MCLPPSPTHSIISSLFNPVCCAYLHPHVAPDAVLAVRPPLPPSLPLLSQPAEPTLFSFSLSTPLYVPFPSLAPGGSPTSPPSPFLLPRPLFAAAHFCCVSWYGACRACLHSSVCLCNEVIQRGAGKQGRQGQIEDALFDSIVSLIPSFLTFLSPHPAKPQQHTTPTSFTWCTRGRASKKGERTACGTKEYTTYTHPPPPITPTHTPPTTTSHRNQDQYQQQQRAAQPLASWTLSFPPPAPFLPPSPPLSGPPPLLLLLGNNGPAQSNNTHDNKRAR